MDKIALIETTPSSTDFHKWFEFDFDRFALCSDSSKKKILKRDVDIDIDIEYKADKKKSVKSKKSRYGSWA